MLYDAHYDVTAEEGFDALIKELKGLGLRVVSIEVMGPAGGNPCILTRGTREAHVAWLRTYADDGSGDVDLTDDDAIWNAHAEWMAPAKTDRWD